MLTKIEEIEHTQPFNHSAIEQFLLQKKTEIETKQTLSSEEISKTFQGNEWMLKVLDSNNVVMDRCSRTKQTIGPGPFLTPYVT